MKVRVWVILILMSVYTWTSGFSQQRVTPISGNVKVIGGSIHYEEIGADPAVILIHGAGHIVNMERPVEFNRIVADFLARIRQRGGP